jgi:transposase-like protein
VLVELRVVDQRVSAVHEVLDGATVVGVAARYGVSRQTVHRWLRKYADDGVKRPRFCAASMRVAALG